METAEARSQYIRWLLVARDLSPHTIRAYKSDLVAFERYLAVEASTRGIDSAGVLAFLDAQRRAGLSSASIRRRASTVRGYGRWLLEQGLTNCDPWPGSGAVASRVHKLPRLVPAHDLRCLLSFLRETAGLAEIQRCEIIERPHAATTLLAVALIVATGMRVSEVAGIRCADIDLAARTVRVLGKGRRERQVFLTNDWISSLTRSYLRSRTRLGVVHHRLLFNRRCDPLTAPAIRARLLQAAREAGLRTHVTPHMLRHTAATQLIEAGVDIRYIQRLLGHASLTTTEIYTHVSDGALRRVVSDADVLGSIAMRG